MEVAEALGYCGTFFASILALLPAFTWRNATQDHVRDWPIEPHLFCISTWLLWVLFGVSKGVMIVLVVNGICIAIDLGFLIAVFRAYPRLRLRLIIGLIISFIPCSIAAIVATQVSPQDCFGVGAMIMHCLIHYFPARDCYHAQLRLKPVWRLIPFVAFLSAASWVGYGALLHAWYILTPNCLGLLIAIWGVSHEGRQIKG